MVTKKLIGALVISVTMGSAFGTTTLADTPKKEVPAVKADKKIPSDKLEKITGNADAKSTTTTTSNPDQKKEEKKSKGNPRSKDEEKKKYDKEAM